MVENRYLYVRMLALSILVLQIAPVGAAAEEIAAILPPEIPWKGKSLALAVAADFFHGSLQRAEYAEGYVMEPMAERMLAADPAMRAEFEKALKEAPKLAASREQRLDWFYRRTPFFDDRYLLHPVARE